MEKVLSKPRGYSLGRKKNSQLPELRFEIPLKGSHAKSDLSDNFVKVIEQEYAVRYLEHLGVEPTQKNIYTLLKKAPLANCEIQAGWNNSGWLADAIYIIPRGNKSGTIAESALEAERLVRKQQRKEAEFHESEVKRRIAMEEAKNPHLQASPGDFAKMLSDKLNSRTKVTPGEEDQAGEGVVERLYPVLTFENIKQRYLHPFVTKTLSKYGLESESALDQRAFQFPFKDMDVDPEVVREIQQPIEITIEDILSDSYRFVRDFPIQQIPFITENNDVNDGVNKLSSGIARELRGLKLANQKPTTSQADIEFTFEEIKSNRVARLIGLVSHYVYWMVFGSVNHLPIDEFHQNQLFLSINQLFAEIEADSKNRKNYATFTLPLVVLAVRYHVDVIFANTYQGFFSDEERSVPTFDRFHMVISRLLDPDNYFSRISFLESGMDAIRSKPKSNIGSAGLHVRNRFYTTSALIQSLFSAPNDGKTRAVFARKRLPNESKMPRGPRTARIDRLNVSHEPSSGRRDAHSHRHLGRMTTNRSTERSSLRAAGRGIGAGATAGAIYDGRHNRSVMNTSKEEEYLNMANKVHLLQVAVNKLATADSRTNVKRFPVFKLSREAEPMRHQHSFNSGSGSGQAKLNATSPLVEEEWF